MNIYEIPNFQAYLFGICKSIYNSFRQKITLMSWSRSILPTAYLHWDFISLYMELKCIFYSHNFNRRCKLHPDKIFQFSYRHEREKDVRCEWIFINALKYSKQIQTTDDRFFMLEFFIFIRYSQLNKFRKYVNTSD
jgi:hypothetical protein